MMEDLCAPGADVSLPIDATTRRVCSVVGLQTDLAQAL